MSVSFFSFSLIRKDSVSLLDFLFFFFLAVLRDSYHLSGKSNSASKVRCLDGAFVIVFSVTSFFFLLFSACKAFTKESILFTQRKKKCICIN